MTLAKGDMRKVINVLQSTWMGYKNVTEETVYTCVGHPLKSDIKNIIHKLLNSDDFKDIYQFLLSMKVNKGLALEDIITEIHILLHRSKKFYYLIAKITLLIPLLLSVEMPPRVLSALVIKLAEIEQSLAGGASENPQISAMISAFQIAKDSISV